MSANMIVGRVETYGRSGKVEDWMTFTDYEKFREHVLHDLSCGCPIGIVANKIPGIGVKTPTYWVMDSCYAFHYCSSLTTAILRSETMCSLDDISVFADTPISKGTGYIYVPNALVESYQAHEKWSTYADQFRAIEDYPDICGQ